MDFTSAYSYFGSLKTYTNYGMKCCFGGEYIVTASGNNNDEAGPISIWSFDGAQISTFRGHRFNVSGVDISQDRTLMVSGAHDDTVKVWDVNSSQCLSTTTLPNNVSSVGFINDDSLIVAGCHDDNLYILDKNGSMVQILSDHHSNVNCFDTSSGNKLISGGCDYRAILWDLDTGTVIRSINQDEKVNTIKFMDANIIVAGCSGGSLNLSDLRLNPWKELTSRIDCKKTIMTVSRIDENRFASGGFAGNVDIWDSRNLSVPVQTIDLPGRKPFVMAIDVAENGMLCVARLDCSVDIFV